jgi:hypothetical protein
MAHSTYIDCRLPSDFILADQRGDDLINDPEAACYFCGLHFGKEEEELGVRLGSTRIDCKVLKGARDYFKPTLYVCRSGDDLVAHENCLQWGENVWQPTPTTLAGVDKLIDNCEMYTCDLCNMERRASVACSGSKCRNSDEMSTYHFPCILLLFLNGMAKMDTAYGTLGTDLAIRCMDCYASKKNTKRCRFIDYGATEETTRPKRHVRRGASHQQDEESDGELSGL